MRNCLSSGELNISNIDFSNIFNEFQWMFEDNTQLEMIYNVLQIYFVYKTNKESLSKIHKYAKYQDDKKRISELIEFLNCTWKKINLIKEKNKLILKFPDALSISNGERDILSFIGQLFLARKELTKQYSILIFDEIFDYLDDANIISVQYYISKFIDIFKKDNREIFPILLTHLDPEYFKSYNYSIRNRIYLDRNTHYDDKFKVKTLIINRERCRNNDVQLYDGISSLYLHFSPSNSCSDIESFLESLKLPSTIVSARDFRNAAIDELRKYIKYNSSYDVLFVCCGLRIIVEKVLYLQLSDDDKKIFLTHHTTIDKIQYAATRGIEIPDIFYILTPLYNAGAHIDPNGYAIYPIQYKFNNKVIHQMVKSCLDIYDELLLREVANNIQNGIPQ